MRDGMGERPHLKQRAHGRGIGQLLDIDHDNLLGRPVHALLDHVRRKLLHAQVRHLIPYNGRIY